MKSLTLQPVSCVNGTINLIGSKSISNRVLLLSALANGTTVLMNLLDSEDVRYMLNALKVLGIQYVLSKKRTRCEIIGNKGAFFSSIKSELFLGNAGTVMRLLTGILCLNYNNTILTGEPRMKKRPIGHLVQALHQGGAKIIYLEQENYPPIHIYGGFTGGKINVNSSISSQFLTALLLTSPLAQNDTIITVTGKLVSRPYIDITLHLMKIFGIKVKNQSYQRFFIWGKQKYSSPGEYLIEGDATSASYFLSAAAIKGGKVKVFGIGKNSIQDDISCAKVLEKMQANITLGDNFIASSRGRLQSIDMDMGDIPDSAMTIAVTALFAKGITTLRNIYNWRVKETDRLFAMTNELRKVGATIKEGKDYIRIIPPIIFQSAEIETYNDHRMAMCFSLIALSGIPITILNPKCTEKTFPNYFKYFKKLVN